MKPAATESKTRGFTILEVSMVVVIIGLLMGGLVIGKNFVRSSELRSVVTQYTSIMAALDAFKSKYSSIPGDMPDAISYWGAAHATPATCVTTASIATKATCNGNGDGVVDAPSTGSNEIFRFWQHLANANFIIGEFDGIAHGAYAYSTTRANAPSGKITGSLWFTYNWGPLNNTAGFFNGNYKNTLEFGFAQTDTDPNSGIMRAQEMRSVDEKIDDGKPGLGKLRVRSTNPGDCTTATLVSDITTSYKASSNQLCVLLFPTAY